MKFKSFILANNKLMVFLENSYILIFNVNGTLERVEKLPTKINSFPIVANGSLIYLDDKNKASIIN